MLRFTPFSFAATRRRNGLFGNAPFRPKPSDFPDKAVLRRPGTLDHTRLRDRKADFEVAQAARRENLRRSNSLFRHQQDFKTVAAQLSTGKFASSSSGGGDAMAAARQALQISEAMRRERKRTRKAHFSEAAEMRRDWRSQW